MFWNYPAAIFATWMKHRYFQTWITNPPKQLPISTASSREWGHVVNIKRICKTAQSTTKTKNKNNDKKRLGYLNENDRNDNNRSPMHHRKTPDPVIWWTDKEGYFRNVEKTTTIWNANPKEKIRFQLPPKGNHEMSSTLKRIGNDQFYPLRSAVIDNGNDNDTEGEMGRRHW